MHECIIVYRDEGEHISVVRNIDGSIKVFPDLDAAITYCDNNKLYKSGQIDHQIVELDEL